MCVVTLRSILENFSNDVLKEFSKVKEISDFHLYPCHIKAVELYIRLMTDISVSVERPENRD